MLNVIIIDSISVALQETTAITMGIGNIRILGTFSSIAEALKFAENKPVDLFIAAINGAQETIIPSLLKEEEPPVIFTSYSPEYVVETYNKNVLDYLLKPFKEARFAEAINKVKDYYSVKQIC